MKTVDYARFISHKDTGSHEHRDTLKDMIHEKKLAQGKDHIHDHKLSINREQVMDMHERAKNKTRH